MRKNYIELGDKGVLIEFFVTVGLARFSAPSLVLTLLSAESGRGSITFQGLKYQLLQHPYTGFRQRLPAASLGKSDGNSL
jgi:hypothetical protein